MQILPILVAFVGANVTLLAFHQSPWVAVSCAVSLLLVGLHMYLEKSKVDDLTKLSEEIKNLKDQVNAILIGRGFKP